jgi:hypothetical protein
MVYFQILSDISHLMWDLVGQRDYFSFSSKIVKEFVFNETIFVGYTKKWLRSTAYFVCPKFFISTPNPVLQLILNTI